MVAEKGSIPFGEIAVLVTSAGRIKKKDCLEQMFTSKKMKKEKKKKKKKKKNFVSLSV